MTYKAGEQHVLIGETNFGDGCGGAGKYSVFARISHYRDWIDKNIRNQAKFCQNGPQAELMNAGGGGPSTSPAGFLSTTPT